jgi:hypothetical protein
LSQSRHAIFDRNSPALPGVIAKQLTERRKQMTPSKLSVVCAAFTLAGLVPTFGADENGRPGTVNYFTAGQEARAFAASDHAGYTPTIVETFQDGNFFLTASKGGQSYEVTVVPSGQVYPSIPVAPLS